MTEIEIPPATIADDLMNGCVTMAKFLYGKATKENIRRVRHLLHGAPPAQRLPSFKLGGKDAAFKSTWLRVLSEREAQSTN